MPRTACVDVDRLRDVERQIEDLTAPRRGGHGFKSPCSWRLRRTCATEEASSQLRYKGKRDPLKQLHRQLFQDERISLVMLSLTLDKGFGQLRKLHDAGVIPSASVPVFQERLDIEECICGTPLTKGSDARSMSRTSLRRSVQLMMNDGTYGALPRCQGRSPKGSQRRSDWTRSLETLENPAEQPKGKGNSTVSAESP